MQRKEDDEIEIKINEMEKSKKKHDNITNEKDVQQQKWRNQYFVIRIPTIMLPKSLVRIGFTSSAHLR